MVAGCCLAAVLALAASVLHGQGAAKKPLTYDVVSVKASSPDARGMAWGPTPDGVKMVNVSFVSIMEDAYGLDNANDDQVIGLPQWTKDAHFDLQAKVAPEDAAAFNALTDEEKDAMLRAALEDRFKLKAHHEVKQLPIYALVVAKGGSKLKVADPADTYPNGIKMKDHESGAGMMETRMMGKLSSAAFQGCMIDRLVPVLTGAAGRTVVDKTGLTGKYDFKIEWTPDWVKDDSGTAPRLFTALQEQLGLKLEPDKGPVDSVVVDHVEKPSAN